MGQNYNKLAICRSLEFARAVFAAAVADKREAAPGGRLVSVRPLRALRFLPLPNRPTLPFQA
jgi:hypothetical protein